MHQRGGMTILLILLSILLEIAKQLCFKAGAHRPEKFYNAWIWLGIILWAAEVLVWIRVLQLAPLSVAFPMMSLCYAGLPLASRWLLGEQVTPRQWAGIALITLGVAGIGLAGIG